jgi:tRNA-dihydrouridine synthase
MHYQVVGNGDVVSVAAAQALLAETGCHGIMIGRGAVQDPLLFHRIRWGREGGRNNDASLPFRAT